MKRFEFSAVANPFFPLECTDEDNPSIGVEFDNQEDVVFDENAKSDENVKTIVLWGCVGSGKSTIFKQFRSIYEPHVVQLEDYQCKYVGSIRDQCRCDIRAIRQMIQTWNSLKRSEQSSLTLYQKSYLLVMGFIRECEQNLKFTIMFPMPLRSAIFDFYYSIEAILSEQGQTAMINLCKEFPNSTPSPIADFKVLWKEPVFKEIVNDNLSEYTVDEMDVTGNCVPSHYVLSHSTPYFLDRLDFIFLNDMGLEPESPIKYIPNEMDIIKVLDKHRSLSSILIYLRHRNH